MPRKAIDTYIFYKIVCLTHEVNLSYVGSTTNMIKRRSSHKRSCENENHKHHHRYLYQLINQNGGWTNFKIVELETIENISHREANEIEENYRLKLQANMNTIPAYSSDEKKLDDNRKRANINYLIYKQNRVDCECGCNVIARNLDRHRTTPKHLRLITTLD